MSRYQYLRKMGKIETVLAIIVWVSMIVCFLISIWSLV